MDERQSIYIPTGFDQSLPAFRPVGYAVAVTTLCVMTSALSAMLAGSIWPFVFPIIGVLAVLFAHRSPQP